MGRMNAHNRVVTNAAYEPGLLAVVGPLMVVVRHAVSNRELRADRRAIEPTGEIDPFATVAGPRLAAEGNGNVAGNQYLLEFGKMLAQHIKAFERRSRSS